MALLDTLEPSELLGFLTDLAQIERDETLWELYIPTISNPFIESVSFDEFKKMDRRSQANQEENITEDEVIRRAENILNMNSFVEVKDLNKLGR